MVRAGSAPVTGFNDARTAEYLKNSFSKQKSNWKTHHGIELQHVIATVTWTCSKVDLEPLLIRTPVPDGIKDTFRKSQSNSNLNHKSVPKYVLEWLGVSKLTREAFNEMELKRTVSFATPPKPHESFTRLYCIKCEKPKMQEIWKMHSDKLPAERNIKNLINNWDKLDLSWMWNDVIGAIIPKIESQYVVFNARKMITDSWEHEKECHPESSGAANANTIKKYAKKRQGTTIESFRGFTKSAATASSVEELASGSDLSGCATADEIEILSSPPPKKKAAVVPSKALLSPKGSSLPKGLKQTKVTMLDPEIRHGDTPRTPLEEWAVGNAYAFVHESAGKNLSNAASVAEHKRSHQSAKDLRLAFMDQYDLPTSVAHIPRFTLNQHNITSIQREIMQTYRWEDNSPNNPYRHLEKCDTYSIMHDGTSVWVKPVNAIFARVVDENLNIHKVPYSLKKVPGSFTGEVLCEELVTAISGIKKVDSNAFDTIESRLINNRNKQNEMSIEQKYKCLNSRITELSKQRLWSKVEEVIAEIQAMENEFPELVGIDIDTIPDPSARSNGPILSIDIPTRPDYFKIATITAIDEDSKEIRMSINPANIPTCQNGDACSVNIKGARLVEEKLGIPSPLSKCNSHLSSGVMRRATATSKSKKQWDDADTEATRARTPDEKAKEAMVNLSKNLKSILCHFAQSGRSTEILNAALAALEMHEVHQLTWGSTRMCSFLDSCLRCSTILVPLLDTIASAKLKPEQSAFLMSPNGLFVLQLLADLQPVLVRKYLKKVDKDENDVLICEAFNIASAAAQSTSSCLTPRTDEFLNRLSTDENNNITATFLLNDADEHTVTLNKRITNRHASLEKEKTNLGELKSHILNFLAEQIKDLNSEESLSFYFSCFDLSTNEDLESRLEKLEPLFNIYGVEREHGVDEKWFEYQITIILKARLNCTLAELRAEFSKEYPWMNIASKELRKEDGRYDNQRAAWQEFYRTKMISCPNLCKMLEIMFSVAVNTGWVERAYSTLEAICPKRRNRMDVPVMQELLFLSILKLPVRSCFEYKDVIKNANKTFPVIN